MIQITTARFKRVDRRIARMLFDRGEEITVCLCKLSPESGLCSHFQKNTINSFESLDNAFRYYWTGSNEVGYYPAYYVRR